MGVYDDTTVANQMNWDPWHSYQPSVACIIRTLWNRSGSARVDHGVG
jgi:hypothetical protein